jgi:hypothetical protein
VRGVCVGCVASWAGRLHIEEAMTIKLGRTTVPPDVARDRRLAVWVLMTVAVGLGFLVKLHT